MKKSIPALSHQPPKGIDSEKYESLAGLIEPYADGQFAELLDGLRERVIEEFSPHSWDELTPFQRRSLARDYDAQHDPALKIYRDAGMHIGYYRPNHVQAWLTLSAVSPQEAALLFHGKNPFKFKDQSPFIGDEFDSMQRSFEDAARDGVARNLLDWIAVARDRDLHGITIEGWEACATIAAPDSLVTANAGPVVKAPAQGNSTKMPRSDSIDPVIKLAQAKCSDPQNTNEVWPQMQVLAQNEHPPFLASMPQGLKFHKGGKDAYFTRDALNKRLHPEKRKAPVKRR